jgi:prolactin regulatory element-binding protein
LVEGDVNDTRLFVLVNPVGRQGKHKAILQLWLPKDGSLKKAVPCSDNLSALAVSDDGRFVAVGTMFTGSVSVYVAFSLQVQALCIIFFSLSRMILK